MSERVMSERAMSERVMSERAMSERAMSDRAMSDRVDSGKYMMFARRPIDMNADMVWDRLWFMIKNSDEDTDIDMIAAWADMWVMKTYKGCIYLEEHMEIIAEMEKELYV